MPFAEVEQALVGFLKRYETTKNRYPNDVQTRIFRCLTHQAEMWLQEETPPDRDAVSGFGERFEVALAAGGAWDIEETSLPDLKHLSQLPWTTHAFWRERKLKHERVINGAR